MGRAPCCDKEGLKRGPWTPEEDKILVDYITAHGHGSWRSLPKLAGLLRCGKSCRLRWTNYLRPDIKRGPFTNEEQKSIIQLHAIVGNKWSTIAAQLPGRTDNEIKNYWNTHLKKKLLKLGVDPDAPYVPAGVGGGGGGGGVVAGLHHRRYPLSGPTSSPPSSATRHMAQWESARLEAEARLSRESHLFSAASGAAVDVYQLEGDHGTGCSSPGVNGQHHEEDGNDEHQEPPDFFLRIWNSNIGRTFRTAATAATAAAGCSPAASSSTRRPSSTAIHDPAPPLKDEDDAGAAAFGIACCHHTSRLQAKEELEEPDDDSSKLSSGSGAIADCSWTSSNDFVPAGAATDVEHEDDTNDAATAAAAAAAAAAAEESYQMYLDFATAAVDDMAGLFHAHVGCGGFSALFAADLTDVSLDSAFK